MPIIRKRNKRGGDRNSELTVSNMPILALTDTYKISHMSMYDKTVTKMIAYGECRSPLKIDKKRIEIGNDIDGNVLKENRLINFGLTYIIENYIDKEITEDTIKQIKEFYGTHGFIKGQYPINENLIDNLKGRKLPVKIYGLPEGTVMLPHTPVYKVVAEGEFAPLVTFLETILTQVWYPIAVATLSRCCKDIFRRKYIEVGVPESQHFFLDYSLHDFGFRGCSSIETSIIGGMSHLLNFEGTDTMSAAYYAQYKYNDGTPVGESVPASEHSVMTSYISEYNSILEIMKEFHKIQKAADAAGKNKFGWSPLSLVMDSYDYENSLMNVFPAAVKAYIDWIKNPPSSAKGGKNKSKRKGGEGKSDSQLINNKIEVLRELIPDGPIINEEDQKSLPQSFSVVFRPDSGNPIAAVIQALIAGVKIFGIDYENSYTNKSTGIVYIKPKRVRVLQGDGINVFTIQGILDAITDPKCVSNNEKSAWAFSPFSILCGMGGGLLQKVNRDTPNFATKLCYVKREDNEYPIMKDPATAPDKRSLPGDLVVKNERDIPKVYSLQAKNVPDGNDLLELIYDGTDAGMVQSKIPKGNWFSKLKETVQINWENMKDVNGKEIDARSDQIKKYQEEQHEMRKGKQQIDIEWTPQSKWFDSIPFVNKSKGKDDYNYGNFIESLESLKSPQSGGGNKVIFYKKIDGVIKKFKRTVKLNKKGEECVDINGKLVRLSKIKK